MNGCYCAEQVMLRPCVESFDTEIHHPFGIYVSDHIITRIDPFYYNLIPIPSLGHIFFSSVSVYLFKFLLCLLSVIRSKPK